jgi:hypothetical protein
VVHSSLAYVDIEPEEEQDPIGIGMRAWLARALEHENHILACKRVPIKTLMLSPGMRPPLQRFMAEALEYNQQAKSCCRNVESHEIEAWFTSAEDAAKGVPDVYVIHCSCGRWHRTFCVGGSWRPKGDDEDPEKYAALIASSKRPFWEVR